MTTYQDRPVDHTDFDAWVLRVPEHVDEIHGRLWAEHRAAARRASLARRRPFMIDPVTGHTPRTQLCWVCGAMPVHRGPTVPTFRACRFCIGYDRAWAARLGLGMVLPFFDWPSQPVLPGRRFPTAATTREVLAEIWSGVSVLHSWHVSLVQAEFGLLGQDAEAGVDLYDWQQRLTVGLHRSKLCWRTYVDEFFPDLPRLLGVGAVPADRAVQ